MAMSDVRLVDLRSDTVTRPSPGMRKAIAEAQVGDDVFGDDPTVNCLQEKVASLLGKEAAIYVPSGTMANQTAIRAQTQPGDEIIAHGDSHIYHYEAGAPAGLSGCSLRLLGGERGLFHPEDVRAAVRPLDCHFPRSALVVVENTQNRGGGSIWPIDQIASIYEVAEEHGLRMHLDGARLMNACVATGHSPQEYTRYFDTVAICFSKGLGAPVGSAVTGSVEIIERVHRFRKMFGGGMRQAGIIAAGALYALEHNVDRLAEDHANAGHLADALAETPGISIDPSTVETNIVYFDIHEAIGTAQSLCDALYERGVWMLPLAPQRVRAVTHLDVSREDINRAITAVRNVLSSKAA
ncbi:MAG: low-specificity L-threonine aldolase [Phycisphaerales bacterium]|nr:MAG: low-specificity L-threonine aldolase [Phycisphaerales bacterium]